MTKRADQARKPAGEGTTGFAGQREWREYGPHWVVEEHRRQRKLWFVVGKDRFCVAGLGRTQQESEVWFRARLESIFGSIRWLLWLRKVPAAAEVLRELGYDLASVTVHWPVASGESWRQAYYGLVCACAEYAPPGMSHADLRAEAVSRRFDRPHPLGWWRRNYRSKRPSEPEVQ